MRIFLPAGNHATLYNYTLQMRSALENDRFAQIEETYEKYGYGRSNLRYGYVSMPLASLTVRITAATSRLPLFFAVRLLSRDGPCSL